MFSQAAAISAFGLTFYIYGLFIAAACIAAGTLLLFLSRNTTTLKDAAALTCLLSPVLGLVIARVVYCLFDSNFRQLASFSSALDLSIGGLSMFGALLGAVLGTLLAARRTGVNAAQWLDILTPALFLFVAIARLGEGYTTLGISRPLITGVLDNTFLAFRDEYDAYLRTYYLESAMGLLLCGLSLRDLRKDGSHKGDAALTGALLFGLSQNLFESLRYDGHLRYSFVGLQQVLSVVLFTVALIVFALRLLRQKNSRGLAITSLCALPLILAAILGIEFMIDRSQLSKWLSYCIYVLVLLVPMTLGLLMRKRSGYNG
jgi:prolipoprotein diacylglyceryltransferase